jgi:hypothetical protein
LKAKASISTVSILIAAGLLVAGCGGGGSSTSTAGTAPAPAATGQSGGGEVPSEAESAATGDIPDNQNFLLYRNRAAGYSIRYPEGWARKGSGADVTFREKANVIQIMVRRGAPHSPPGVKTTHARMSAPDPVTGKRLKLVVDRYEYGRGGMVAVLDLSTPEGVDNVDAYRLISESFKWTG